MLCKSYIAATQQLYYIRLQNWAKPNITCEANITAQQYNSPKANIVEKNGNRITITVLFWQGHKDLNPEPTVLETAALPIELYPYI